MPTTRCTRSLAALAILLFALPAFAQDPAPAVPLSPKGEWTKMQAALVAARKARDMDRFRKINAEAPNAFLARWKVEGGNVTGDEAYHLGLWYDLAERRTEAMSCYLSAAEDESLPEKRRVEARVRYARAVLGAIRAGDLKDDAVAAAIERVEAFAAAGGGSGWERGNLHGALAALYERTQRNEDAIERYVLEARALPIRCYNTARTILPLLLHDALDLEKLEEAKDRSARIDAALSEIHATYAQHVGDPHLRKRAETTQQRIEGYLTSRLESVGTAAPEWTLVHSFQGGKTLAGHRGEVVVLDFWATWCPWCIRSFPALRDLLRDYAGKPLAVVGVTASATYVFEQRWDLDDDLRHKATKGERVQWAARRPDKATDEAMAAFRKQEIEVIGRFIVNHEMTWDVLMIDPEEPAAKYALSGWPHAVVIDKQGRIRYLKSGALRRDRPDEVAKFRAVLDRLLAEKGPGEGQTSAAR